MSDRADVRTRAAVETANVVSGREALERLLQVSRPAATLDLIGHSLSDMLELGDWVIDAGALPWFRIHAAALRQFESVRLIGCHTAASPAARSLILAIADVLGIEVYGATGFLFHYHFTATGFDPTWRFLLTPASELRQSELAQRSPIS